MRFVVSGLMHCLFVYDVGKSTLLRLLAQIEDPNQGFIEVGSRNLVTSYYAQNQADELDLQKTVYETIADVCPTGYSTTDIRTLLGQFMFKNDDVEKVVGCLSGGEKSRLALCRMILQPSNLLLLDEVSDGDAW